MRTRSLLAAFFVPERNGALMQEIAAVLIRSLARVAKPIIEVIALRNCTRRRRSRHLRLGSFDLLFHTLYGQTIKLHLLFLVTLCKTSAQDGSADTA